MQRRVDLPPVADRWWRFTVAVVLVWIATVSAAAPGWAVLIAEDRFLTSESPAGPEYAVGFVDGQSPSTLGFGGPWFTSDGAQSGISGTSLNYADASFPAETGGRLLSSNSNSRVHRLLGAANPFEATDSGTVYMSFLLQSGTNNGYRAFEMHYGGNTDAAHRTLQIGLHNGGDFPLPNNYGFRVNNNGSLEYSLGVENAGANLFLVKFGLSTTNNADTITVWQNPSLASLINDPAGGVVASGFNFAADRLGIGHYSGTAIGLDELRVGTSLREVLTNLLICDVNGNGVCNSTDINIISQHMYLPGAFADGDIDGSGTVDFDDYRLFKYHPARVVGFDVPGGGSTTAPEPTAILLLGAGCLGWCYGRRSRSTLRCMLVVTLAIVAMLPAGATTSLAAEQDLLNDSLAFSGVTLNVRPFVTLPTGFSNIISMTTKPNDTRLFVTTQEGTIFTLNDLANGGTTAALWFNVASAVEAATDQSIFGATGHDGLQSTAFHPDFEKVGAAGYGKFYTTHLESAVASPTGHKFLGNTTGGGSQSVLAEWTYNHATGAVASSSYRELFRVQLPVQDHKIKQARFNPYAAPGDEDYGLLYLTHGDSSSQQSTEDRTQHLDNALGKMLRINPLAGITTPYTVPDSNPFVGSSDPNVLQEIYAYGFRNPHNFSFNEDDAGNVHILVGDIGRNNIEEVNLVTRGGNYGWGEREGTFVHKQGTNFSVDAGYIYGVSNLAANEDEVGQDVLGNRFIYPVAQYDHNGPGVDLGDDYVSVAIASGFVIRNGSDPALQNQFIFNNFGGNVGNVGGAPYHTDFNEMLSAVTQLDPNDASRDDPSELTQATVHRLQLALDHDSNPGTAPQLFDDWNDLLGVNRNDARYGEGVSGEMYVSNKINNTVYLVTNSVANNKLTLTVDRGTGAMSLTNSTGQNVTVDNLSVFSPSGSLEPGAFQSLGGGWSIAPENTDRALNQNNSTGSLALDGMTSAALGNAYDAKVVAFGQPAGEDLQLLFTTDGPNGRNYSGNVVYTGMSTVPNTIVLTVDMVSGAAVMLNQTPFAQEIEGYTIASTDGSLDPASWNSLDAQGIEEGDWIASPAIANRLTEFQEDGTTTFDNATPFDLGQIFQPGAFQDLAFEFLIAGETSLREGQVTYVFGGDFNGDHVVDAADYTVWRDNLNTTNRLSNDLTPGSVGMDDYLLWKANFGASQFGAGGGSLLAVPEPGGLEIAFLALAVPTVWRRRLACL